MAGDTVAVTATSTIPRSFISRPVWEIGSLGDWKIGRLGVWEIGRLGDWDIGRLGDLVQENLDLTVRHP